MKAFRGLLIAGFGLALTLSMAVQPQAKAQGILTVTKITSSTVSGGSVLLENTNNADALAIQKGRFYVRTKGYTGGVATFVEHGTSKVIWRGPVSGVTITGYATDSLKILFLRQFLTN